MAARRTPLAAACGRTQSPWRVPRACGRAWPRATPPYAQLPTPRCCLRPKHHLSTKASQYQRTIWPACLVTSLHLLRISNVSPQCLHSVSALFRKCLIRKACSRAVLVRTTWSILTLVKHPSRTTDHHLGDASDTSSGRTHCQSHIMPPHVLPLMLCHALQPNKRAEVRSARPRANTSWKWGGCSYSDLDAS